LLERIRGNLDLLPFDEAVRTVAQGFAPSKDSGLRDLDAFEKNLAVGFLQGEFIFELPPDQSRVLEPKMRAYENPSAVS